MNVRVVPRVIVVDHYDSYTYNLVHLIASVTGSLPDVTQHDHLTPDDLGSYSHVVLSPGPGHPGDPAYFALGPEVFTQGKPVLGVCLGMQALVLAYDGVIEPIAPAHGEVAVVDHDGTSVFAGLPTPLQEVRYHSLAAVRVSAELRVTATAGAVVMGVAHRELPLHGVQFHPESILSQHGAEMIRTFLEEASRP
ncbi:MAG: aminodeoxychorismate/anthranilate synthase component II [Nocardioidaceae bacterium]|nr:MAG: aminodeoxychorismate/anthranilate synthase component II [Nocardioidaceae bacterium]